MININYIVSFQKILYNLFEGGRIMNKDIIYAFIFTLLSIIGALIINAIVSIFLNYSISQSPLTDSLLIIILFINIYSLIKKKNNK